ncbi:hypothetical protein KFK09_000329 [Dendrobium nobile]|uniref:CCHC-type domain-containing protein n=1 Tax=Dendrobium nobile TaxID=94219 RepID=A0A8T3C8K3_DENNO|nr:hypothetical protein KFK09_000329 [Dendrobium nobile]
MNSIAFWNCRGAKKKEATLYLKEVIKDHGILFVGLVETKINAFDKVSFEKIMGEDWDFYLLPSDGLSGGIMVFWRSDLASFSVVKEADQCVIGDLNVFNKGVWMIATIYGNKEVVKRRELWGSLQEVSNRKIPFIVGGDFNCILSQEDKRGGRKFIFSQGPKEMADFLNVNDLHEVGFFGPRFTWCNNKSGGDRILERLDKCLFNSIAINDVQISYKASSHIIARVWRKVFQGNDMEILNKKYKKALKELYYWSKAKIRDFSIEKEKLKEEIFQIQEEEATVGWLSEDKLWLLRSKVKELNSVLARMNTWWRQRAKAKWMEDGDTNSKFFLSFANARRNEKRISQIKNADGVLTEDPEELPKVSYCTENWPLPKAVLDDADKRSLDVDISDMEILEVIKGLGDNKAPGHDGITYSFLKNYWSIIGNDVSKAVREFFDSDNAKGVIIEGDNKNVIQFLHNMYSKEKKLLGDNGDEDFFGLRYGNNEIQPLPAVLTGGCLATGTNVGLSGSLVAGEYRWPNRPLWKLMPPVHRRQKPLVMAEFPVVYFFNLSDYGYGFLLDMEERPPAIFDGQNSSPASHGNFGSIFPSQPMISPKFIRSYAPLVIKEPICVKVHSSPMVIGAQYVQRKSVDPSTICDIASENGQGRVSIEGTQFGVKEMIKQHPGNPWSKHPYIKVNMLDNESFLSEDGFVVKLFEPNVKDNSMKLQFSIVVKVFGIFIPMEVIANELRHQWSQLGKFHLTVLGSDSLMGLSSPIWIRMPNLPLYCLDEINVLRIASLIGQPLLIDGDTFQWGRREFARVCVRVKLDKQLPLGVWVDGVNGRFFQKAEYEKISSFCFNCGRIGHLIDACSLIMKEGDIMDMGKVPVQDFVPKTGGIFKARVKDVIPVGMDKTLMAVEMEMPMNGKKMNESLSSGLDKVEITRESIFLLIGIEIEDGADLI